MERRLNFIRSQIAAMLGIILLMVVFNEVILWQFVLLSEFAFLVLTRHYFSTFRRLPRELARIHIATFVISLMAVGVAISQSLG